MYEILKIQINVPGVVVVVVVLLVLEEVLLLELEGASEDGADEFGDSGETGAAVEDPEPPKALLMDLNSGKFPSPHRPLKSSVSILQTMTPRKLWLSA